MSNNIVEMKNLKQNQQGFIPLILTILAIVVVVVYLAYSRVLHAKN